MDKKKLAEMAQGSADDRAIEQFDQMMTHEAIQTPRPNFTANVMAVIQRKTVSRMGFFQVWSIILGVVVAMLVWALEGFALPKMKLSLPIPQVSQVQSVDMTNVTMVFMMVNALLVLVLIDRWFQHKKRTAH